MLAHRVAQHQLPFDQCRNEVPERKRHPLTVVGRASANLLGQRSDLVEASWVAERLLSNQVERPLHRHWRAHSQKEAIPGQELLGQHELFNRSALVR
jgi:hypothetical protein